MKKTFSHETRGRTAVVTGASSGIGEAFARRLAAEGYHLVLSARRGDLLERIAREAERLHGINAGVVEADLSTADGMERLGRRIEGDESVEVLVNGAGFGTRGLFADIPPERIAAMVSLHALASARLARAALPGMLAAGRGYLINVSSIGAFLTTSRYVTYSATKAFLNMFTLGLADELKGTGVRVQALCPGLTRTGFMRTEEFRDFDYGAVPDFVWMTPEAVVEESLRALKKGRTVFIPGRGNRMFVAALRTPIISTILGFVMARAGNGMY
jgi:short-subunit dehydrogenase